jgi:hypothetical protein
MTKPHSPPATEPNGERLLLSSLAEFWSLIEPLLLSARVRSVCEVGIGDGEFTKVLLKFCQENACRYAGMDSRVNGLALQQEPVSDVEFFHSSSLAALPKLAPHDAYFIDGDHNYYTVSQELKLILPAPDCWPLIFLHDVCWPWGRRDQYCAPEMIPEAFRHPHSATLGVTPGRAALGPGGFSGATSAYPYSAAEHEGGPRNGVLTAVEDFIRDQPGGEWRVVVVPVVFGLGILYAPERCSSELRAGMETLEKTIAPLMVLLESLERNRNALFLSHLQNLRDLDAIHRDYEALAKHEIALRAEYDRGFFGGMKPKIQRFV